MQIRMAALVAISFFVAGSALAQIAPEPGDLVSAGTAKTYEQASKLCALVKPEGKFRLYKYVEGLIAILSGAAESRAYKSYDSEVYRMYALWVQPDDGMPRNRYHGNMFLTMYDGKGTDGGVSTPDQVLEFLGSDAQNPADLRKWLEGGIAVYCIKDGSSTVHDPS